MELDERLTDIQDSGPPTHVAIIPDGNGRWAKKRDLERIQGHKQGVEVSERIIEFVSNNLSTEFLTLYTFSTENWARPQGEVEFLMQLLQNFLQKKTDKLVNNNIKLLFIGDIHELPDQTAREVTRAVRSTEENTGLKTIMALNYGGRQEILRATKKLAEKVSEGDLDPDEIDEKKFEERLYTKDVPDPDLLIRTSGEQRISNFLLWQLAYAEFWTTDTLWPDFTPEEFVNAIEDYQRRNRRFGGVKEGHSR